ncbi:hypothetical protein IRJ41_007225 [Triplophysa rosa]|uniref:Uncharacterized protein n=2 Tax=Triplophysa rosa TaxID=992332 RepID=A0A9W7TWF5_TRIRA|nr:hypothetical protein IRJ41_007225 [Triplophysa rosa]
MLWINPDGCQYFTYTETDALKTQRIRVKRCQILSSPSGETVPDLAWIKPSELSRILSTGKTFLIFGVLIPGIFSWMSACFRKTIISRMSHVRFILMLCKTGVKGKSQTSPRKMINTAVSEEEKRIQDKESKEESILAMLGIIGTILNLIVIIFVYIYTTL